MEEILEARDRSGSGAESSYRRSVLLVSLEYEKGASSVLEGAEQALAVLRTGSEGRQGRRPRPDALPLQGGRV